jgi:DNA-binding beta-propeller fold protein YncE
VKLASALALFLAGCAAQPVVQPVSQARPGVAVTAARPPASRPDRGASWVARSAASSGPLLFVSDFGDFDVDVYSVSSLKLVERITGFFEPQGECADARGDVWIANTGTQQMLKFKPGDKRPIATLDDSIGYPAGCAVDPKTGNLAVTNVFGASGPGGILVYRHGSGTPAAYSNPHQYYYYFAGYDAGGNLYTSGMTFKSAYILSTLQRGKKTMSSIAISGGTLYFPGTVLWNGSSLVLGDQQCGDANTSCLYEASVSGTTASITATIPLTNSCDVAQVVVQSDAIYGGNYQFCAHGKSSIDQWAFPSGGEPVQSVTGVTEPIGSAIAAQALPH